jgi:hypothetical protein
MSSCLGGTVRRTRWAAHAGTEVCNGMGNADGPSAGHALGQIVRNEIDAREGRERPRSSGVRSDVSHPAWGSFTPRHVFKALQRQGSSAAQGAASWQPGSRRKSLVSRRLPQVTG